MPEMWNEQEMYVWIHQHYPKYGNRNHSFGMYQMILDMNISSLVDVGCGNGQFVEWAKSQGIEAIGVDFASGYGIMADVRCLPFINNTFEIATAFDLLEHLTEEDLDVALEELKRVATKMMIFSIGYGRSRIKGPDEQWLQLHPITRRWPNAESWWIEKISKYGNVERVGQDRKGCPYLVCKFKELSNGNDY